MALRRTVPAFGVDVGLAHDGDVDRFVAVDEAGTYVPGDALLVLFARDTVSPGDAAAVSIDTSLLVQDAVEAVGGRVTYTPVGDVRVAEAVAEPGYVFDDEPSGVWIRPDEAFVPDGHYAALTPADLTARGVPLSEQVADLGSAGYVTRHAGLSFDDKHQAVDRIARDTYATYDEVDTIDGIHVDINDGRFSVRTNGTEPLVRITAEARGEDDADRLSEDVRSPIEGACIVA